MRRVLLLVSKKQYILYRLRIFLNQVKAQTLDHNIEQFSPMVKDDLNIFFLYENNYISRQKYHIASQIHE